MAELVDAPDSKSGGRKAVGVRVPLPAPEKINRLRCAGNFGFRMGFVRALFPNRAGGNRRPQPHEGIVSAQKSAGVPARRRRSGYGSVENVGFLLAESFF
jgi:hypothetical protein